MVLAHRPSPCHPTQHSATVMRYTRRNYILCQTQNTILTCFSAKQAFMDWHVWLISTKMSFFFGSVHFHIVWPRGQCLPFNLIFFLTKISKHCVPFQFVYCIWHCFVNVIRPVKYLLRSLCSHTQFPSHRNSVADYLNSLSINVIYVNNVNTWLSVIMSKLNAPRL